MTRIVVVMLMVLAVAGCGRKGRPVPPEDAVYPRHYPNMETPAQRPQESQTEQR